MLRPIPTLLTLVALFAFAPAADAGELRVDDTVSSSGAIDSDLSADAMVEAAFDTLLAGLDKDDAVRVETMAREFVRAMGSGDVLQAELAPILPDVYAMLLNGDSADDIADFILSNSPEMSRTIERMTGDDPAMFPFALISLAICMIAWVWLYL